MPKFLRQVAKEYNGLRTGKNSHQIETTIGSWCREWKERSEDGIYGLNHKVQNTLCDIKIQLNKCTQSIVCTTRMVLVTEYKYSRGGSKNRPIIRTKENAYFLLSFRIQRQQINLLSHLDESPHTHDYCKYPLRSTWITLIEVQIFVFYKYK